MTLVTVLYFLRSLEQAGERAGKRASEASQQACEQASRHRCLRGLGHTCVLLRTSQDLLASTNGHAMGAQVGLDIVTMHLCQQRKRRLPPVSYTHLTLPTNREV